MNLQEFKYLAAAITFIVTVVGCFLPIFIRAQKWTSRCESLAGGVFLGAGFAHLLDDSFKEIHESNTTITYPISGAVSISTFILLTIIEIYSYSEKDASKFFEAPSEDSIAPNDNAQYRKRRLRADHFSQKFEETNDVPIATTTTEDKAADPDATAQSDMKEPLNPIANDEPSPLEEEEASQPIIHQTTSPPKLFGSHWTFLGVPITSLYLIMCAHSFIEGLAMGILSQWNKTIALLCAVAGHKPVEAFALGLIIIRGKPLSWVYGIMMLFYSLLSPAGAFAGIALKNVTSFMALGVVAAISSGTFLFVGCDEWSTIFFNKETWAFSEKTWHLGLLVLGVLWMLLIAIVEN